MGVIMQPVASPRVPPFLALGFGILAVSTAAIFIRFAQAEAPSLVIAFYRLGLSALILAPVTWLRHRQELRSLDRRTLALAALSGLFLAFHFASWITSLELTTVASSVVLVTTTPLWVALFSPLFLKESLTRTVLIGLVLALGGGLVVGLSDACTWQAGLICPSLAEMIGGQAFWGDILALFGAWLSAAYIIVGRGVRRQLSLGSYIFIVYGMAALVLLGLVLVNHLPLTGYTPATYGWFFLLALIPQLFGHTIFNWALRYISAAYVAVTLLGEPIGSTILAYFLLRETPTWVKIIGAILILAGILVASRGESRRPSASQTSPS